MTVYIDPEDALAVVARLGFHMRDEGLLISALARPAARAFGEDAYPTLQLKAAALLSSVARNHALVDGNKRLAWVLTVVFINLNGYDVDLSQNAKFDLVLAVAQGTLELAEIAGRLSLHPAT